jgi:hypothetical protein
MTIAKVPSLPRCFVSTGRARAAECIARAEAATDSRIKSYNQSEAEMWLRLAELTEKQNQK